MKPILKSGFQLPAVLFVHVCATPVVPACRGLLPFCCCWCLFVFASKFSECLFVAVLTNESYLDCRHSNVTNSLQPQARSLQPQARSHQPQPQAPSCSTATSHVVWHQEKREAIMGVLCTQMIDVPSKAMFERTQTNELYSFCVQYSNVGGGKSAPTGTCKACSTKYSDRHAVLACAFPATFAK